MEGNGGVLGAAKGAVARGAGRRTGASGSIGRAIWICLDIWVCKMYRILRDWKCLLEIRLARGFRDEICKGLVSEIMAYFRNPSSWQVCWPPIGEIYRS